MGCFQHSPITSKKFRAEIHQALLPHFSLLAEFIIEEGPVKDPAIYFLGRKCKKYVREYHQKKSSTLISNFFENIIPVLSFETRARFCSFPVCNSCCCSCCSCCCWSCCCSCFVEGVKEWGNEVSKLFLVVDDLFQQILTCAEMTNPRHALGPLLRTLQMLTKRKEISFNSVYSINWGKPKQFYFRFLFQI